MEKAILVKDLEKKYDKFVLGNINIEIPKGSIVGLIGENGAGKTTLIKAILNIIHEDKGQIKILDKDKNEDEVFQDIGVVLDNMFFPEILKIQEIGIQTTI